MACSGLNEGSFQKSDKSNRTMKVLEMALQINNYIKQVTWGSAGQKITLKMGIHYGKVIAGVIGDHKPQFSLIGDTVNTTSRVCSTSEKGIITLSEEAYNEVKDCLQLYQFKLREVEAKGKGTLNTYQVVKVPKNLRRNLGKLLLKLIIIFIIIIKENKNYQMKEVMMMANIKKKENEQNIMKVVEIGRFFNDEKLKDIDEKTILFQKKISLKDNHSLGSKDEYNNESIMKICPKIETIEEYKNKNLIGEDKERQDFRSFPSYSMNSFEHDDSKKGSIYLNHKKNFTRFKRNIAHELLEDLEDIQKIVINKSTSIKGIQNNINLEGISNRTEKKILEVPISNQQRDFKKEEVMHRNSEQTREVLALRNSFFLLFAPQCNHSLIREYEQNLLNLGNTANKVSFLMLSMTSIIQFFSIMVGDVENLSLAIYWLILYGKISHIIFPLILFKYYQAILVKYKNIATFSIIFFACFYVFNFFFENKRLSNILGLVFFLNVMLNINNLNFREIFLCLLIFCLVFIVLVCFLENLVTFSWMETIFLLSNCIFLLFKIRKKNIRFIEQFNALKVSLFHKNQQENLITYLLPPHILTALTQNNSLIVDILDDVTILFADIAGFTKYSSSVSALEVLSMLRELFTEFDRLCFNYKVYKVYTIGDCYVILGILDIKNRDPVMELFKVLMVAFDMLEIIKNVKRKINFNELNMRIGIHTVNFK